jgi:hypothetical protein
MTVDVDYDLVGNGGSRLLWREGGPSKSRSD